MCDCIEKVHVKYNQTGKVLKTKLSFLSKEDFGLLTLDDLAEGSQLILDMDKKSYPVTVIAHCK